MTILPTCQWVADASRRALITLALLSLALPGTAIANATAAQVQAADSAAIEQRNRAIVEAAFEKWRGGTYVFGELLAPDVVWTIHGSGPVAGTYRNQKDFIEKASRPLTSRLATPIAPEVHNIFADVGRALSQPVRLDTQDEGPPRRQCGGLSGPRWLSAGRRQQRPAFPMTDRRASVHP
ncbi:nuclear transport factor 2 family protein [Rhizobium sp. NPDC090275]|uniref:nuclear transport factor 2 family protein n=1 Tax=Rhizobium sp. NPDC090275 TaxID=3364498 RepID=UPI00383A355F